MSQIVYTEDEVQSTIVEGLRALGYDVQITSRRVKRCRNCGQYPKSGFGDGVTKGVADLLVGRQDWGAIRVPIEVKGTETPVSPEQADDRARGMLYIVRSWEEAVCAIGEFEVKMRFRNIAARVS